MLFFTFIYQLDAISERGHTTSLSFFRNLKVSWGGFPPDIVPAQAQGRCEMGCGGRPRAMLAQTQASGKRKMA